MPRFDLSARISSDNPKALRPLLASAFPGGTIRQDGADLLVEATLSGASAKELNRNALSALRRGERKTRLRAEWTAEDGTRYRFFDYVLKRTERP